MKRLFSLLLALFLFIPRISALAQTLEVAGEVTTPLKLTADDLKALPHEKVKAKDHDGVEAEFEGVPLHKILEKAGVPLGAKLRGPAVSLYLLVTASDGYTAVYSLPEVDPLFTDDPIILADKKDGKAMDEHHGPLRMVLPKEKKHARWVRQVIRLEILKASPPAPKKNG